MGMNRFGLGPEGTSHNSPARSAGIECKWKIRPERTVHHDSRQLCWNCLACDPDSRSPYEASLQDAGSSSPARTRHFVPGFYESSRWDDMTPHLPTFYLSLFPRHFRGIGSTWR